VALLACGAAYRKKIKKKKPIPNALIPRPPLIGLLQDFFPGSACVGILETDVCSFSREWDFGNVRSLLLGNPPD